MTNTTPGFAVALVAFGLMARDGIMMIVGMIIGISWISFLFILGPLAFKELIKAGLALVGIGA